jgi:hypothetical protein
MLFEELGLFENFEELGPVAIVENIPASLAQLGDGQLGDGPGPGSAVEDALRGAGPLLVEKFLKR